MEKIKSVAKKVALVGAGVMASASAWATDPATPGAAITAAVAEGKTNYTLVVVGLITMAAVGFGLHMITSSMRS